MRLANSQSLIRMYGEASIRCSEFRLLIYPNLKIYIWSKIKRKPEQINNDTESNDRVLAIILNESRKISKYLPQGIEMTTL